MPPATMTIVIGTLRMPMVETAIRMFVKLRTLRKYGESALSVTKRMA